MILQEIIRVVERSVPNTSYHPLFLKYRDMLITELFYLIEANSEEIVMIETNAEAFIEQNEDFCLDQDDEGTKSRSGSLLAILCLEVDGFLTVTFNISLLCIGENFCDQ